MKLNLEKLAEQMQQVNRNESESLFGGEWFYSTHTGELLGKTGTNMEVRITSLSKSEFDNLNVGPGANSKLMEKSSGWSSMRESNQQMILSTLAGYPIDTKQGDAYGEGGYYDGSGITLNVNWSLCATGNAADLMLMIIHEEAHRDGYGEYGAFQSMLHSDWYDLASQGMKDYIDYNSNNY